MNDIECYLRYARDRTRYAHPALTADVGGKLLGTIEPGAASLR